MEREVAAMATRLESSVGVELKRKEHNGGYIDFMEEFADDFHDVKINGGLVEVVGIRDHEMEKQKTKYGKVSAGDDIELPKTTGEEAEEESGSSKTNKSSTTTTAKPAAGSRRKKRTKMVKYRIDKSLKPFFSMKPLDFDLSLLSESFAAALRSYREWETSVLEQFETKGYADYEREEEEEVTDDDDEDV